MHACQIQIGFEDRHKGISTLDALPKFKETGRVLIPFNARVIPQPIYSVDEVILKYVFHQSVYHLHIYIKYLK